MVVEITNDSSLVGIREVRRVTSLESCLNVCQICAGLVYYPDNTCVIFNKLDRIVFSSFGATCCFAVENEDKMECTRCEGNQSDEGTVSISSKGTISLLLHNVKRILSLNNFTKLNMYSNKFSAWILVMIQEGNRVG